MFFELFIVSVFCAFGLSVLFVEKGDEWPIRPVRHFLQVFLFYNIHPKLAEMFECTVCTSFWMALVSDIILLIAAELFLSTSYFLWPITGFVAVGFTWTIIELLNAIESDRSDEEPEEEIPFGPEPD